MNTQGNASLHRTLALAALLLLATAATGCGVGLPTQPDIDAGAANPRVGGVAGAEELNDPLELADSGLTLGGSSSQDDSPAGEIVVPTPSGPGNGGGWAYGHQKNKWKNRN